MKVKACNIIVSDVTRNRFQDKINQIFDSGMLTLGVQTKEFEEKFESITDVENAVALSCCTAGLEILLRTQNLAGREVIIPANTNFATAAAVIRAGGKVRFADINPSTLSLSPRTILEALTDNSIGVLVVHVGGIISDEIQEIQDLCNKKGLFLIEDAAHAHGSKLNGKSAGTFGIGGAYSFYPTKLVTCGEGGMLVSNFDEISELARSYIDQGKDINKMNKKLGYSWRLSELSAAFGSIQLDYMQDSIMKRKQISDFYNSELEKVDGIEPFKLHENLEFNYYKCIVRVQNGINTLDIQKSMRDEYEIELSSFVYRDLCNALDVFQTDDTSSTSTTNAEKFSKEHICLPIQEISITDAKYVVDSLKLVLKSYEG